MVSKFLTNLQIVREFMLKFQTDSATADRVEGFLRGESVDCIRGQLIISASGEQPETERRSKVAASTFTMTF